jgi:hypothetical protein
MEINERITQVVKSVFGSQSNAARALGVDRQRMNSIVNGVKPGLDFINLLCDKTENLNMHWLIRGEGSMFLKKPEEIKLPENSPVNNYGGFDITLNRILSLWEDERAQWNQIRKENKDHLKELKDEMNQLKEIISNLSMRQESNNLSDRENLQFEKTPKTSISKRLKASLILNSTQV